MTVSLGLESSVLPGLNLMSHVDAMRHIHRPASVERVCEARERLAFEELVLLQNLCCASANARRARAARASRWCPPLCATS